MNLYYISNFLGLWKNEKRTKPFIGLFIKRLFHIKYVSQIAHFIYDCNNLQL